MIDCQLIIKRAIGPLDGDRAHEAMNQMMMKQARDLFHLETLLLRAICAVTELVNNTMKRLWFMIDCKLIVLVPCARRQSSFQVHDQHDKANSWLIVN